MNERTKATVIGGLAVGLPSAIPIVSTCCFIWALLGGFLAVYMYYGKSAEPVTPGDGAKFGLRAGMFGAGIYLVIALPLMLLGGAANIAAQMQQQGGAGMAAFASGLGFVMVFIVAAILAGLAALGGLIGAAVVGKNRPGGVNTPPPPPSYGGPASGGGYGDASGGYGGGSGGTGYGSGGTGYGSAPGGSTGGGYGSAPNGPAGGPAGGSTGGGTTGGGPGDTGSTFGSGS